MLPQGFVFKNYKNIEKNISSELSDLESIKKYLFDQPEDGQYNFLIDKFIKKTFFEPVSDISNKNTIQKDNDYFLDASKYQILRPYYILMEKDFLEGNAPTTNIHYYDGEVYGIMNIQYPNYKEVLNILQQSEGFVRFEHSIFEYNKQKETYDIVGIQEINPPT